MTVRVYGIRTCNTCQKARRWLDRASIAHEWVDPREQGVDAQRLEAWGAALGHRVLLNKRSKTWRDFDLGRRAAGQREPIALLVEHPTLIKRPVLETDTQTLVGFSPAQYRAALIDDR